MQEVDVFIIGAGPAGSIAGAKLVQDGLSVKIVDKLKMPRFVIGESLLPRCLELLEDANMLECVQDAKFQHKGGVAFRTTEDHFTALDFSKNLGQKWGHAFQVQREVFDKILIEDAQKKGCDVVFEMEVIAYDADANIVTTQDKAGNKEQYKAKKVLDASGYGKVLPRLLNLEAPSSLALRRATFTRVDKDNRVDDEKSGYIFVDIVGDNDAWIWNIPFSDGTTSVGVVCTEEYFAQHNMSDEAFWEHCIYGNKYAAHRYADSKKTGEVLALGGYSSNVTKLFGKNFILTGNASEFLDPVFSSGVTLALESGAKAAELTARELRGEYVNYQCEYADYMMLGINVFRDYVNAWYDGTLQTILFHDEKSDEITSKIISILSGYVWDENNSFVTSSKFALEKVHEMVK